MLTNNCFSQDSNLLQLRRGQPLRRLESPDNLSLDIFGFLPLKACPRRRGRHIATFAL